jgi:hypothetical protein
MPDLYLVWRGIGNDETPWGIRCSTRLPNFEQPQIGLINHGLTILSSGAQLLALSDRILYVAGYQWSQIGAAVDYIPTATCNNWPDWSYIGATFGKLPGAASSSTPAIANWGTGALAVWVGIGGDPRIWCSQYNQSQNVWSSQYLTALSTTGQPIQTGAGPAIVNVNGMLLMVWVGEGDNDSLYYATSRDGRTWTGNQPIPGGASTNQPALTIFNGAPVLCFKGGKNDGGIYSTTYNAASDHWATVVPTGPFGTTSAPTLAVYQGQLFMAWKGDGNDTDLWWSVTTDNLNSKAWSQQASIPGVGSSAGPAAVVF